MVGVPGRSKACATCRRRKKGVSLSLPVNVLHPVAPIPPPVSQSVERTMRHLLDLCGEDGWLETKYLRDVQPAQARSLAFFSGIPSCISPDISSAVPQSPHSLWHSLAFPSLNPSLHLSISPHPFPYPILFSFSSPTNNPTCPPVRPQTAIMHPMPACRPRVRRLRARAHLCALDPEPPAQLHPA